MTNNFCEAAMRVLKDQLLHRTKKFNVQQLLDFILSRMEAYYQRRCLYVANPGTFFADQSNSTQYNVFLRKNLNENQPTNGSKMFWKILFELLSTSACLENVWPVQSLNCSNSISKAVGNYDMMQIYHGTNVSLLMVERSR